MEKLSKKFVAVMLVAMMVLFTGIAGTFDNAHALTANELKITKYPQKTEYKIGDTLDTTGLELNIVFDDGSVTGVGAGYKCSPTTLNTPGKQKITVSYSGLTCEFYVNVSGEGALITTAPNYTTTTRPVYTTVVATQAPTTNGPSVYDETTTRRPAQTTAPYFTTRPHITHAPTQAPTEAPTRAPVETTTRVNHIYDSNRNIVINAKVQELSYGQGTYITAEIVPDNSRHYDIVWTSSDSSVASVDSKGHVVANGEGSVIITAKVVDGNGYEVYDSNGNEIKDTVVIKCTMTIWQKIVRFFRNLFSFLSF